MLDNDLIRLFRKSIVEGLALNGWTYPVIQRSQPTQQGIPTETTVFFQKLYDYRYGSPCLTSKIDLTNLAQNIETTTQNMETTFQVSVLSILTPAMDTTTNPQPTASDISNYVANILQRRDTVRKLLAANNVNVLRIQKVDNTYFEDDRHRNEAWPTFEVVLTHQTVTTNIVNNTDQVNLKTYQVPD